MVGVVALIAEHGLTRHLTAEIDILAIALPHTAPQGLAPEVHDGGIHPRNEAGTALVGSYLTHTPRDVAVERGSLAHLLREERRAPGVGRAVDLVDAIDLRHLRAGLHRDLVEPTDKRAPYLGPLSHALGHVQDAAHMVLLKDLAQRLFVQRELGFLGIGYYVDGELTHLPDLLVEREFAQCFLHLCLHVGIDGDGGVGGVLSSTCEHS